MTESTFLWGLTWTNIILLISTLVTIILGSYKFFHDIQIHRSTKFVDNITGERIKWLEKLRGDISRFSGLTSFWSKSLRCCDEKEAREVLKEIDILRVMIKLRLNPNGKIDNEIIKILDSIPLVTNTVDITILESKLDQLTIESQKLLKEEWNRVKAESRKGAEVKA